MEQEPFAYEFIVGKKLAKSTRVTAGAIAITSALLCLFHIYTGQFSTIDIYAQRIFCVSLVLILAFFLHPLGRKSWREPLNWFSIIDIVLILGVVVYCVNIIAIDYEGYVFRFGIPSQMDIVGGTFIIFAAIEAARRTVGSIIPAICLVVILMNIFGEHLPAAISGPSVSWSRIVEFTAVQNFGMYGTVAGVLTGFLILFFMFAALLQQCHGGDIFLRIALAVAGRFSGGPAKVAVVGSAVLGTIIGTPTANVATTGSVTIPMMKRMGYKPELAAAVEANASIGSNIMPPIMGTAAFLMASFLEIPYIMICLFALIPAWLYFLSIFMAVHFEAKKAGLVGVPREELPSVRDAFSDGWVLIIPIAMLVYFLVRGYGLADCVLSALAGLAILTLINKRTRWGPQDLMKVFERTARTAVTVGCAIICLGILVGNFAVSGMGDLFASLIITASGGSLIVGLVITAFVCLVLGSGMSSTPVYLTVVVIGVPGLVALGCPIVAAHFFCFYWGMLSGVTPPVCIPLFVAAAIAKARIWSSALIGMRLCIIAYMIAFLFPFFPQLLFQGPPATILTTLLTATVGVVFLTGALAGYFLFGRLSTIERVILGVGGIFLVIPQISLTVVGLILVAMGILLQWFRLGRGRSSALGMDGNLSK